jgi:hypothetical protein
MQLTLDTLNELFSGHDVLNDGKRFLCIRDYVETFYNSEDNAFPFALILIAAISEGTNPNTLAHFCQLPLEFVTEVAERLTTSGLWLDDGSVDYDFLTAEPGLHWEVCFSIDVFVARGVLASTGEKKDNLRGYYMTEAGRLMEAEFVE